MQESSASASPAFFPSLRARVALACLTFAASAFSMWDGFFRFDWVGLLCFSLYWVIYVPMQKEESRAAYLRKPRSIVSTVLIIFMIAGALHSLVNLATKHGF